MNFGRRCFQMYHCWHILCFYLANVSFTKFSNVLVHQVSKCFWPEIQLQILATIWHTQVAFITTLAIFIVIFLKILHQSQVLILLETGLNLSRVPQLSKPPPPQCLFHVPFQCPFHTKNHITSTTVILSRSTMFLLNAYLDVRKAAKTPNVRILGMDWWSWWSRWCQSWNEGADQWCCSWWCCSWC